MSADYLVKNVSPGNREVQTEDGNGAIRHIMLRPGESQVLRVHKERAQWYAQVKDKYGVEITPDDATARRELSGSDDTLEAGEAHQQPAVGQQDPSQELLSRADQMDLNELRLEAKMILGQKWPRRGGNDLTREQIRELLNDSSDS